MILGQTADEIGVQGLHPTSICDGHRHAVLFLKLIGSLQALAQSSSDRKDGQLAITTLTTDAPPSRLQEARFCWHYQVAIAATTGKPQRCWLIIDFRQSVDHVDQLCLISRRAYHHVGNAAHVGKIKAATVGGSICPYKASSIQDESNRQFLKRHIMNQLVIASLQERGVDGAERLQATCCHPGRKGHRMLFRDAHIEGTLWAKPLLENADACPTGHRGCNRDDLVVALALPHQRIPENLRERRRLRRWRLITGTFWHVELRLNRMQLVAGLLGWLVTIALLGLDVEEHRLLQGAIFVVFANVRENLHQSVHVVPINGPHVVEPKLFKKLSLTSRTTSTEGYSLDKVARVLVQLRGGSRKLPREKLLRCVLGKLSRVLESRGGLKLRDVALNGEALRAGQGF
mmetsp:Transcript_132302/g.186769  ORF Transcript_132302/g.186769 Transcript_132302/m.186769 type:complete len:402 (-) Transcript_132302:324-1529(-)